MHRLKRTKRVVFAAVLATIVAALVIVVAQGRRTPDGLPDYVALGSSYAAGAGLGPLEPGSPWLCARSVNGYPQKLARLRRVALADMSCGGAVTRHLLHGGQYFQGPQLRTITRSTRLVTITIGGNDIGYVGDLSLLAARHTNTLFGRLVRLVWQGPRTDSERGYAAFRRDLSETLLAVRARAPAARIILATYPPILPRAGTCPRLGLSAAEAGEMRAVGDTLARITGSVARQGGATLVDVHALGIGHDACSDTPWTTGWTNGGIAPFHPTDRGAMMTARAISANLDSSEQEGGAVPAKRPDARHVGTPI